MAKKNFYILAGPNGAGKTTLSQAILRDVFHCENFINADEIAKGLSPFDTEKFNIQAGRIMLKQIDYYTQKKESFCIETTLSSRIYLQKIKKLKKLGYKIFLFFIYLPNEKFAIKRVKQRVLKGGHNIETEVIKRRYKRGLQNLMNDYFFVVDNIYIYSNIRNLEKVAFRAGKDLQIHNKRIFRKIKKYQNDN